MVLAISTETSVTEEPREGKLHARICAGGQATGIPTVTINTLERRKYGNFSL
ncbi:hypothetical protein MNBD_GAMMA18-2197 [hydrothermal vent metagenome]|uniref:Uncharacterized protein n=1 Tax=hydrothermal vent metagenome TaxID=652676 RepID=A0A3B0ZJS3_9ZZZZ